MAMPVSGVPAETPPCSCRPATRSPGRPRRPVQPQGDRGHRPARDLHPDRALPRGHRPRQPDAWTPTPRSWASRPPTCSAPTAYGQDLFAQLVWGTRNVLIIAFVVGLATTAIAVLIGVAAAYLGGLWDSSLGVLTDVLLVIPLFPLLIVIAAYAHGGGTLRADRGITLTSWSYTARQLRAQALTLRNRDFLEAARVRGERRLYIIVMEVIPTMTSLIVASFLTNALYAVLFASSLQFIGLGDPNTVSWGTMLYWAQNNAALQTGEPLWAIAPGACIAVLGAAFALLNYAFDEIGNPALRPGAEVRRQSRGQRSRVSDTPMLEVSGLSVDYVLDRAMSGRWTTCRSPSAGASSSASWASRAAGSRRCCSPSPSCSPRRPAIAAGSVTFEGTEPGGPDRQAAVRRSAGGTCRWSCRAR